VCVALFKAELNFCEVELGAISQKSMAALSLYSTGSDSYMQTRGSIGGPRVVGALLQQLGLYS
jgi:hypothetical protein